VTERRRPLQLLRVAIVLALVFNLLALVVLIRPTPIAFTLFMFLAQPLMVVALVLLVVAVVAELRARQVL
jgi:hypothetical protein